MTTKNSPLPILQKQARQTASLLKRAGRGEPIHDYDGKIAESIARGKFTTTIVADNKMIKITMTWAKIRETEEDALVEFILAQMREEAPNA